MSEKPLAERVRALWLEIEDGPTFDPTRRDHMSTLRELSAIAAELEKIAEEMRKASRADDKSMTLARMQDLIVWADRLARRKE